MGEGTPPHPFHSIEASLVLYHSKVNVASGGEGVDDGALLFSPF